MSPSVRDGRDSAVDTIHAVWLPSMVDDLDDFEGDFDGFGLLPPMTRRMSPGWPVMFEAFA